MEYPKIVVIGAGSLSSRRIYPYIGMAEGILVGSCDLEIEKAKKMTALFGGKAYDNWQEMIEKENPDGVIVCISPAMHAKLAKEILEKYELPVYTEKPPSLTSDEALDVARIAKQKNILCMTGFKKRYNNAYNRAKKFLAEFEEKDWLSLSIDYGGGLTKPEAFLFDFGIHAIDLVGFLFGDVDEVFAFQKDKIAYSISLKFKNSAVGSMNLTCNRSYGIPTEEVEITVRGGNFISIHNSSIWKIVKKEKGAEWREPPTFISAGDSGEETGHLLELKEFFNAIKNKKTRTKSWIYESYKSMVLYESIVKSIETKNCVKVLYKTI